MTVLSVREKRKWQKICRVYWRIHVFHSSSLSSRGVDGDEKTVNGMEVRSCSFVCSFVRLFPDPMSSFLEGTKTFSIIDSGTQPITAVFYLCTLTYLFLFLFLRLHLFRPLEIYIYIYYTGRTVDCNQFSSRSTRELFFVSVWYRYSRRRRSRWLPIGGECSLSRWVSYHANTPNSLFGLTQPPKRYICHDWWSLVCDPTLYELSIRSPCDGRRTDSSDLG